MIVITIKNKAITIKGHALYDDYGKDIVCSAVSSIVTTTINGSNKILKDSLEQNYQKEILTIKIKKTNNNVLILIENMLELLEELAISYPKNIKIIKEVK